MAGSFDDFLDALLAFESGWDRERYNEGVITDAQLDSWAGGSVEDFFSNYTSWSDLTDAEWDAMAYRSMNSYGFVGYQFGEALLIDLGYYDDDVYYGNGASTNTWDGTWTGKNGVDSLEEFMTKEAQDVAIVEEFGFNLEKIEDGLAAAGKSLDDYVGTTLTYTSGGTEQTVELTLTGILASAHLRGYPATIDLLLNGTLSADEYGTSILQYMAQFGGFDSPDAEELIAYFEDRLTGDEGVGTPEDQGSAGVTADTADVVIDWAWGTHDVVTDFDPATDTVYVGWFTSDQIDISESAGSVVFSIASNNQTVTLQGITLADLSNANFTIEDSGTAQEILALVGEDTDAGDGTGDTGDVDSGTGDSGTGDTDDTGSGTGDTDDTSDAGTGVGNGLANVTAATATVAIDWAWGTHDVVTDFDPATDTVYVGWFTSDQIDISESAGSVVFSIASNNQTVTLQGVTLAELSDANFTIRDDGAAQEILALVSDGANPGDETGDSGSSTGDTGDAGTNTGTGDGNGTAEVSASTATVAIDWAWGTHDVVTDFDPATDTVYVGWFTADQIDVSENDGSVVFSIASNNQTVTLQGVSLSDLSDTNFTIRDDSAAREILALVGQDGGSETTSGEEPSTPPSEPAAGDGVQNTVHMTWDWGAQEIVSDFSPTEDILDFGTLPAGGIALSEVDGDLHIEVLGNGGHTYVIENIQAEDLTLANLAAADWNEAVLDDPNGVIEQLGLLGNDDIA